MSIPTATLAAGAFRALPAAAPITLDQPDGTYAAKPGWRLPLQTRRLTQPEHGLARPTPALRSTQR